jgi:Spy/CpxP family protein refolding chaperone
MKMKQRGWLMAGGAVALTVLSLQAAVAHDGWNNSPPPGPMMGVPGHAGYGPGYQDGYGSGRSYGDGYGHHGSRHGMGEDRFERLHLTDEQRQALRKIMRDARSDFRSIENRLSDARYALYDLLDADKVGKDSDKLADTMGDLMAERIKLRTAMRIKINKVLTKEQREEARDMPFFDRGYSWQ